MKSGQKEKGSVCRLRTKGREGTVITVIRKGKLQRKDVEEKDRIRRVAEFIKTENKEKWKNMQQKECWITTRLYDLLI